MLILLDSKANIKCQENPNRCVDLEYFNQLTFKQKGVYSLLAQFSLNPNMNRNGYSRFCGWVEEK